MSTPSTESTESTPSTASPQPASAPWPVESDAWDHLFRPWAEALLAKYDALGGMISLLIGQFIACAWRLRHVNYYELSSNGMSNRDWMRAHKFAQHAFSRAQIDFVRWARLLLPELRRRARLGDPEAESRIATLLELPPLPPPPPPQVEEDDEDMGDIPSTDTFTSEHTPELPEPFAWRDFVELNPAVDRRNPVFKGTRVPVEAVGSHVAAGWTDREILRHMRNVPNRVLHAVEPWMVRVGRACEAEQMCGPWENGVPTVRK